MNDVQVTVGVLDHHAAVEKFGSHYIITSRGVVADRQPILGETFGLEPHGAELVIEERLGKINMGDGKAFSTEEEARTTASSLIGETLRNLSVKSVRDGVLRFEGFHVSGKRFPVGHALHVLQHHDDGSVTFHKAEVSGAAFEQQGMSDGRAYCAVSSVFELGGRTISFAPFAKSSGIYEVSGSDEVPSYTVVTDPDAFAQLMRKLDGEFADAARVAGDNRGRLQQFAQTQGVSLDGGPA